MATKKKKLATGSEAPAAAAAAPPLDLITRLELFLEARWRTVVAVLAIGIGAVVVFFYMKHKKESTLTAAGNAYTSAQTTKDYEEVFKDHAGTPSAGSALLRLAGMKMDEKKYDGARTTLNQFIGEYEDHPMYYSAVRALGTVAEKQGNYDEALEHFQKVIDAGDETSEGALATVLKAEIYVAKGELEKAKEVYDSLGPNYAGSQFVGTAEERVKLIEGKLERLAAPKAPVEPEPEPKEDPTKTTTPGEGTTTPGEGTTTPGEGTTTPGEGTTAPEEGTTTPGEGTTAPEEGTTAPEEGTTAPEEGTTAPEEGTTAPEEGTTAPEEGTTAPEEGTTAPGEGTTAPEEGSTAPEEGDPESGKPATADDPPAPVE